MNSNPYPLQAIILRSLHHFINLDQNRNNCIFNGFKNNANLKANAQAPFSLFKNLIYQSAYVE